jgi:hypothetical protein
LSDVADVLGCKKKAHFDALASLLSTKEERVRTCCTNAFVFVTQSEMCWHTTNFNWGERRWYGMSLRVTLASLTWDHEV